MRTCRRISLLTLIAVLMISVVALAQQDSSDLTKREQDDKILRERINNLGLIIPDEVKRRFEELDKQPPPVLLNTQDYYDWRYMGGVTPVKAQGNCGSCWDFAATGAFESSVIINTGLELDLSEQQVLSCNTGGSSCNGGWMEDAYAVFAGYGAVLESCMPYQADDTVPCTQHNCEPAVWVASWQDIPNNVSSIKNALLTGPVSTTFMVWSDFHWNCYWHDDTGDLNHAVVIVGWDDNMCGGQGAWIVKNSWGTGWGDNGYFYMPYGSCGIGRYTELPYTGSVRYLTFSYPNGLPDFLDPTGGTTARVEVSGLGGSHNSGTGLLNYNFGSGWSSIAMTVVTPDAYDIVFPASVCGMDVNYYISVETLQGQVVTDPIDGPSSAFLAFSADSIVTVFEDNFNINNGWTVENSPDLTDGSWERGIPVGGGDRGDPLSDHDGSGYCFVTDNADDNSDVDGGYTWLISPILDLTDSDALVRYALWYTNNFGADPNNDLFKIWVSSNGGSNWTLVETVGPNTTSGWTEHSFFVGDYVVPSGQVKVRFEASDLNDGSVVEAGIDAVSVVVPDCGSPPECVYVVGDVNGSEDFNGLDITYGVAYLKGGNTPLCDPCQYCPDWFYCGDVNGSCSYNGLDITYGVAYLKGGPSPAPCGDCPPPPGEGIITNSSSSRKSAPAITDQR